MSMTRRNTRAELLSALARLERREGPCRVTYEMFGRAIGLGRSGARSTAADLVKAGLVQRVPVPWGGRGTCIGLTEAGREALDGAG